VQPLFQLPQDVVLHLVALEAETALFGAYLLLGVAASLCYAITVVVFTFLALHSRPVYRWSLGFGAGVVIFLVGVARVADPDFALTPGGFVLAWLPYSVLYAFFVGCFRLLARPSSPRSIDLSIDQQVALRMDTALRAYLALGMLLVGVGLACRRDEARAVVGGLLALMYQLAWALHVYHLALALDTDWGYEWLGRRTIKRTRGAELLADDAALDREEQDLAHALKTCGWLQGSLTPSLRGRWSFVSS
jgi:hypothetical protein